MLKSTLTNTSLLFLFICLIPASVFGQLERKKADVDESVLLTFMAPKNINLRTI